MHVIEGWCLANQQNSRSVVYEEALSNQCEGRRKNTPLIVKPSGLGLAFDASLGTSPWLWIPRELPKYNEELLYKRP
jgi:hypothetical protein